MSKKVIIEIEVKEFGIDEISIGDIIEYNDDVIVFNGYEYGEYPFGTSLISGETVNLPSY